MRIHTFGLDFELDLTSLDAGLAAHLAELWRHSEVKPDTDQEPSDNPIRLQVVPENDTTSPVPEGWDRCGIPTEPRQASYAFSQAITHIAIQAQAGNLLMLHAAGLQVPGSRDVIGIAAPSGTGKSTFASRLAGQFNYVTDECLGFDPETLKVYPYPKPISLVDPQEPTVKGDHAPAELGITPATELTFAGEPLRMAALLIAERVSQGNKLEPLTLAEALTKFIAQTSSFYLLPNPLLTLARALTLAGGPWQLSFSDQAECAELFKQLLEHPADPPSYQHIPGSGDVNLKLTSSSMGTSLGDSDRLVRAPYTDAIYSEWQTVVLVGTVPVLLDGAGAAAWMACPIPHTLAEIHADVVAALGEHRKSWNLVDETVDTLLAAGLLQVVE